MPNKAMIPKLNPARISNRAISSKMTFAPVLLKTKRKKTMTELAQLHFAAWNAKGMGGIGDGIS